MRKLLSYLLIISGLAFIGYPLYREWYAQYWQDKLLEEWEQQMAEDYYPMVEERLDAAATQEAAAGVDDINEGIHDDVHDDIPHTEEVEYELEPGVIGIIKIDIIDANLPILEGTDKATLKKGIGHIKGTAPLGEIGNAALAGHRSHTYGRMFNRLDELDIGDEFTIITKRGQYVYKIYNKVVVKPSDVSVLEDEGNESIVTLITCHPFIKATHRLIIQGRLEN